MSIKKLIPSICMAMSLTIFSGCASVAPDKVGQNRYRQTGNIEPAAGQVQPSQPQPGGRHYQTARADLAAGDLDKATVEAKLALQDDPRDAAAHFLLGCLLERKGMSDQALVAFQRAVEIDPANPDALYNLGTMLLRRGEALPASRLLEKAVLLRPDHLPSYNNLAKAYFLTGLPELAVATYEEALRRDPYNAVALRNLMLLAEGAGLKDAAAGYRKRLQALGPGLTAKPAIDAGEPITFPTWPVAGPTAGLPSPTPVPDHPLPEQQPQSDPEIEALRSLLRDLPHVNVERRAGRLTLTGWTSGASERETLDRILGNPPYPEGKEAPGPGGKPQEVATGGKPQLAVPNGKPSEVLAGGKLLEVLDLTTKDAGDPQRMIEVDAVLFIVTELGQTNVGFNFLKAINMNFKYFASDLNRDGSGFLPNGTVGAVSGLAQQGWFFSASVDYLVNIANASEDRVAVLARPHLTTLSQTPAGFLAGGELVYKVSGNISGDIKPYPFGTKLTVTPTLLRTPAEDGTPRVHLKVTAERKSVLSLLDQDPNLPTDFLLFTVSSEAVLNMDQTLILSGLSQRESHKTRSGVPGLRSIPILKYLFSTESTIVSDAAVVILLTPRDPAFIGERNQKALSEFLEKRRAFLRAKRGTEEDMKRFRERYPDWQQLPPNRFASHLFLMENSEIYRTVSQQELTHEDLNLELLGPKL